MIVSASRWSSAYGKRGCAGNVRRGFRLHSLRHADHLLHHRRRPHLCSSYSVVDMATLFLWLTSASYGIWLILASVRLLQRHELHGLLEGEFCGFSPQRVVWYPMPCVVLFMLQLQGNTDRRSTDSQRDYDGFGTTIVDRQFLLGTVPQQLRCVLVVLIPKATTGFRPIGIFCAFHRLWGKCRTATEQVWENPHTRPHLAASKGRSVTDPVWG